MKKVVFKFLYSVFLLIFLEILGYLILNHINLEGNFDRNNKILIKIRNYLINPQNSNYKPKYLPHLTVGYIHNPDYYSKGIKQNNVLGWRGKKPDIFKKEEVFRIVCMGGSTTYGYGVESPDSSYPAILENKLSQLYPDKKIEVINAGVEGYTSFDELKSYLFMVKYLKPDAIIIKSGGNDAADNTNPAPDIALDYSPDLHLSHLYFYNLPGVNPRLRFLMKSYFLSSLNIIINYVGLHRNDAAQIGAFVRVKDETHFWFDKDLDFALSNLKYYSFYNNFRTLVHQIVQDGIDLYILPFAIQESHPDIEKWGLQNYVKLNRINNYLMREITEELKQTWIPLYADSIPADCWLGDDCHFNTRGNEFKAEFISKYIKME